MFVSIVLWSLEGCEGTHIHLNNDGTVTGDDAHGGYPSNH